MQTNLQNLYSYKPAPTGEKTFRQDTDWRKLSNENLKFSLDLLSLHQSPYEVQVANEITRRIQAGEWLDMDKTPPPLAPDVPKWLKTWPFSLLWSQRPR